MTNSTTTCCVQTETHVRDDRGVVLYNNVFLRGSTHLLSEELFGSDDYGWEQFSSGFDVAT